jgi:hypothetical protein
MKLEGAVTAPPDFYVGNTNPILTSDIVVKVLVKCAAGLEGSPVLEVLQVEEAGTELVNRRTKCWKVLVTRGPRSQAKVTLCWWWHWKRRRGASSHVMENPRFLQAVEEAARKMVQSQQQLPSVESMAEGFL